MVLALLAMGLGCSEEPPEQWSHPARDGIVDGCVSGMDDPVNVEMLEEAGCTVRELCRNMLKKMEALYTESDFRLLGDAEKSEVMQKVAYDYGREIGSD